MFAFTIITGVASLVGFAIQVFDLFPKFARFRNELLLFVSGLFFGSLLSMLTGVQIALSAPLTPMQLLIGAVALITAFLIVSARYQTDADHRAETYVISLGGTILLVLLVFFYGVTSLPGGRSPALTIDEYISLADRSKTIGNLDHSIALLEEAQSQFSSDDVRYARLQSRIDQLKRSQVDDACREAECRAA